MKLIYISVLLSKIIASAVGSHVRVDDMIVKMNTGQELRSASIPWPDGIIFYQIEEGLAPKCRWMLKRTMKILEEYTCIRFVESEQSINRVFITHKHKGCYSHVGYQNQSIQDLNLGKACWSYRTVAHELIHTIGYSHEHQRNDRDEFITVMYENVKKEKRKNFMLNDDMGMIFSNLHTPYNFASIMHYGPTAFSSNGKHTILPKDLDDLKHALYTETVEDDGHIRPRIGLKVLTWGDITNVNLMYASVC